MSFKSLVSNYKKVLDCDGNNFRTEYQNSYKDNLIDSFFDNIAYTQVTKNFDYVTTYDTWIFEGDTKDKEVPYKRLLSYPYNTVQFSKGDYINFSYGGIDTIWLLTTLESQHIWDVIGRIYRCNETLKWTDSEDELQEYPCVIEDRMAQGLLQFNPNIALLTGVIYVVVKYDANTILIAENDKFLFKGQAFKVTFVNSFIAENCITFTMEKDLTSSNDDTVNNVAVPEILSGTSVWS